MAKGGCFTTDLSKRGCSPKNLESNFKCRLVELPNGRVDADLAGPSWAIQEPGMERPSIGCVKVDDLMAEIQLPCTKLSSILRSVTLIQSMDASFLIKKNGTLLVYTVE